MIYLIAFWWKLSLCHLDFLYLSQLYVILFIFGGRVDVFSVTLLVLPYMFADVYVVSFLCLHWLCWRKCQCLRVCVIFLAGCVVFVCFSLVEQRQSKFLRRGRNDTYVLLFFHYYGSSCPWCYDGSWTLCRIWVSFRWHFCVTFTMTLLAEMSSHHNVVVGERDLFWWWFSGTCSFRFFLKLMTNGLFSLSIYGLTMILVYARKFYKIFSAHLERICAFIFIFY